MEELEKLYEQIKRIRRAQEVCNLFYWDMQTVMPAGGVQVHSDTYNHYERKLFNMETSKELKDVLEKLSEEDIYKQLNPTNKFIVKRMLRNLEKNEKIPRKLANENIEITTKAQFNWKRAKKNSDYSLFENDLYSLISVKKEMYRFTDPEKDAYDAMIDKYEEGMTSEVIDGLFEELKKELIPLLKDVLEREKNANRSVFEGKKFDISRQKEIQDFLLKYIGFDFSKGVVGETEHPFTMSFNSGDVRITNHFYEDNVLSGIFSAIHEGGHAIFEQNINPDYDNSVAGGCDNMGIHESQSRFYENVLGRNINFWIPIYDKIREIEPEFNDISLNDFAEEIIRVKNDYIRVDADELTYCLHIILRYEMEKAIFRDNVPVDELPKLWNQKMEEYLFITPLNDSLGILQDSHWSGGDFGYFPSYLLGSIYDGMLLEQIEEELGSVDEILKNGDIIKITRWLNEKI
nr:carboxypeptidase M32 [Lachnospiraceae bacterium]